MKTLVIRDLADLNTLLARQRHFITPWIDRVVFNVCDMNRSTQLSWEKRLNHYLKRCGCVSGFIMMLLGLVLTAHYGMTFYAETSLGLWLLMILGGLVAAFFLGFVGKMGTLFITSLQFRRALKEIYSELEQT